VTYIDFECKNLESQFGAREIMVRLSPNASIDCTTALLVFVCFLLLNGTSALFRPLVPRIVEIEHTNHVKNDLK